MQKLQNHELNRPGLEEFRNSEKLPLVIILDNVRSALNVGSVFRSADAFAIHSIFLCGITPAPPHREIQKTALGATESVNWKYFKDISDAIKSLRDEGFIILAAEQTVNSTPLEKAEFTGKKTAIIFGHEMDGVQQEVINQCDSTLEINQQGTKHSLNIAVCAGIICWEYFRKNLPVLS